MSWREHTTAPKRKDQKEWTPSSPWCPRSRFRPSGRRTLSCGSGSASQLSAEPTSPPKASSSTTSWASCPTQCLSPADHCYSASILKTRMLMRDSKHTTARTSGSQSGSWVTPYWTAQVSATADPPSCSKIFEHCCHRKKSKEYYSSASS